MNDHQSEFESLPTSADSPTPPPAESDASAPSEAIASEAAPATTPVEEALSEAESAPAVDSAPIAPYTLDDPKMNAKLQRKKNRVPLFICISALVLVLSAVVGLMGGALVASAGRPSSGVGSGNNLPVLTNTVVNVTDSPAGETNLSKATAKAYHSVVVIDTFSSQSAVETGDASGAGSGVIWTADGYIVTCNHVINGFSIIRVTLSNGSSYFAEVVGTDVRTDLAVLRIQASGLPAITARTTDLVLAETVIAIGNPLGVLSNTVTSGILSCLARSISIEGQPMTLIQIDAAVNHGNSGGGLFDTNGSLIGIVNAKSTGNSVEGIGFAIPINTVLDVCNQLIQQGYVNGRPRLGIEVVTVNQSNSSYVFNEEYYPKLKDYATTTYRDVWGRERTQVVYGVYIYDASRVAGYAEGSDQLQFGDRVLLVGNTEISELADVLSALAGYNAGDTIQMTVQRDQSKTIVVNIILGQQGAD